MNIPSENVEIEQIYSQVLAQPNRSLAICAANANEGVTSLAIALAQRNLLAGHATLVVDLNLYHPALEALLDISQPPCTKQEPKQESKQAPKQAPNTKPCSSLSSYLPSAPTSYPSSYPSSYPEIGRQQNQPLAAPADLLSAPALVTAHNLVLTGITAPNKRELVIKLRQPGVLESCIAAWMQEYTTVIIDTSPLNRINAHNIPPERVAAACDGTLLMVMAGQTTETMVSSAISKLQNAQAHLLGCVFNDRDNPGLKDELLRKVTSLSARFNWLSRPIAKFLRNNKLLTMEL